MKSLFVSGLLLLLSGALYAQSALPYALMPSTNYRERRAQKDRELQQMIQLNQQLEEDANRRRLAGKQCEQDTKVTYANLVGGLQVIPDGEHFVQMVVSLPTEVSCMRNVVYVEGQHIVATKDDKGQRVPTSYKLPVSFGKAKHIGTFDSNGKKISFINEIFFIYE